jgi:hypothetical protein
VRTDGYADASRSCLAKARQELDGEDLVQASEKVWGAAAQIVKAVAEKRGWRHDSHRALVQVVNRLAEETGDQGLRDAFIVAQGLHFNFYENIHPHEFVDRALTVIEEFVGKLERV